MTQMQSTVLLMDAGRRTPEGYLEVNARTARTGIQLYNPSEIGLIGDAPVRVYRDEAEVFAKGSLDTFAGIPITIGHPKEMVTSENHDALSVGHTGKDVLRDGEHLRIGLKIMDAKAVRAVDGGLRDLSVGYTCLIDATPGTTPQGEAYDARQMNIVANHVAIVPRGRAGSTRIGDARPWGAVPLDQENEVTAMADNLQTVVAFDEAYAVNDDGAKLHKAMNKALGDAEAERAKLADKIAELEAKDTAAVDKIADLEKQLGDAAMTPAQMRDAVRSYKATMDAAAKIGVPARDMEEMSEEDMKAAAVKKKMGDKAAAYTADQIATAFDILAMQAPKDSLVGDLDTPKPDVSLGDAYDARAARLADAWKPNLKQEAV